MILGKGSCTKCRDALKTVDQYLARNVFYKLRLRTGIRSKNIKKKKHPTTLTAKVFKNSDLWTIETDRKGHPFHLCLPAFQRPGILRNVNPSPDFGSMEVHRHAYFPEDAKATLAPREGDVVGFVDEMLLNPHKFCRAIAKIAHGAAAYALQGTEGIKEAFLPPLFLGTDYALLPHYIGSPSFDAPPYEEVSYLHWSSTRIELVGNQHYVVVQLRLFAPYGSLNAGYPIYEAVIGTPTEDLLQRLKVPVQLADQ